MTKKASLLIQFAKNIVLLGSMFIVLSIVIDWYRKPTAPAQFSERVLYDVEQQPKIIAQLSHNRPMLLYFWGSWCTFCSITTPFIQDLAQEGVPVLSVALKSGDEKEVISYMQQNNYTFSTINDPTGAFSRGWDIQATPTILIIKDGVIINHTTGLTTAWGLKLRLWLSELFR